MTATSRNRNRFSMASPGGGIDTRHGLDEDPQGSEAAAPRGPRARGDGDSRRPAPGACLPSTRARPVTSVTRASGAAVRTRLAPARAGRGRSSSRAWRCGDGGSGRAGRPATARSPRRPLRLRTPRRRRSCRRRRRRCSEIWRRRTDSGTSPAAKRPLARADLDVDRAGRAIRRVRRLVLERQEQQLVARAAPPRG